jgi:hypothetical protein
VPQAARAASPSLALGHPCRVLELGTISEASVWGWELVASRADGNDRCARFDGRRCVASVGPAHGPQCVLRSASFTAEGLVGLVPALAIMLGANVGTTLIVQILSFNVSAAALLGGVGGFLLSPTGTDCRASGPT